MNNNSLPSPNDTSGDKEQYIYRVADMIKYLTTTFGAPDISKTPGDKDFQTAFQGKQGIIVFQITGWKDATGHVTIYDGKTCGYHCYFNDADYKKEGPDPATTVKVFMWILK